MFWEVGKTKDGNAVLQNPQLQNSYSYASNNPITNKDPDGRCPLCLLGLIGATAGVGGTYAGDVLQNRAEGLTGLDAYKPRSSLAQYGVSASAGAVGGVVLTESLLLAGGVAALGSAASDVVGGQQPNLLNAGASTVTTIATGGLIKVGVGNSLLESAIKQGSKITESTLIQGLRYATVKETFGTASNILTQDALRTSSQNLNKASYTNGQVNQTASLRSIISRVVRNLYRARNANQ